MENNPNSSAILDELKKMNKLLALLVTEGKTREHGVGSLSGAGFMPKDIAEILGIAPNAVSVVLYQSKKKAASKKTKTPS